MIPLEQQVTSLELSKRLKELGVKQDSLWYWGKRTFANGVGVIDKEKANSSAWIKICSAFTVVELGEMLKYSLQSYYEDHDGDYHISIFGKTIMFIDGKEADARAKMLIYLIKNKLMEVK